METPEPAAALADPPPPPIEPPPYSSPPARASDRPAISRRRLRLLRWLTYGSLAAFVVYSVISGQVGLRRQADFQLVANTTRQIGNNELQATVNDLSSRWLAIRRCGSRPVSPPTPRSTTSRCRAPRRSN